MLCKLEKNSSVLISQCDNTGHLSIPSIFSLFGDLASEHAPSLGLGSDVLAEKGLFWVAVRTKIKINTPAKVGDALCESTWPEAPGRARCTRYYMLEHENSVVAEGKTEWAIVDLETGRPHKLSEIYPENLEHLPDVVCEEPFIKITEDFSGCELLGKYTIRSIDIDLGQHMNNARYIHALFGLFTCCELSEMNISFVEINFRAQCYEGDELSFFIRTADDGAREIGIIRPDGKCAATARIA